jgi:hypothetical protein
LYRPIEKSIGEKYTIVDYEVDAKEKLEEIPMDIVLGSIFFLYNLGMDLSQAMMSYLEGEEVETLMQQQISHKNGDGIKVSLDLLKEILQDLKISLN